MDDPETAFLTTVQPLSAIVSASWPSDNDAIKYSQDVTSWVKSLLSHVVLTSTAELALPTRINSFPVTITNDLEVPVHICVSAVKMTPVGSSVGRLDIPTTDIVTVEPGAKLSLPISARVVRQGDIDVTLGLTTSQGTVIGTPVLVHITARESAWLGWVVVGSAFILFGVGTFLRVRSARKKARG